MDQSKKSEHPLDMQSDVANSRSGSVNSTPSTFAFVVPRTVTAMTACSFPRIASKEA